MIALKPILQAWLEEAEAQAKNKRRDPDAPSVLPAGEKKRYAQLLFTSHISLCIHLHLFYNLLFHCWKVNRLICYIVIYVIYRFCYQFTHNMI